jgi:hypothetical protein
MPNEWPSLAIRLQSRGLELGSNISIKSLRASTVQSTPRSLFTSRPLLGVSEMNYRRRTAFIAVAISLLALPCTALASLLPVDEVLFQGDAGNASVLSGTVEMTISDNTLTIVLTNTSTGVVAEGNGAGNLLTAVGLTLPNGFSIAGGSATVEPGSQINWSGATDVSQEWGFSNTVKSGHFNGSPSVLTYNNVVGTVVADVGTQFQPGSLGGSRHVGGPDFGILSNSVAATAAGGQSAQQSPLTLVLTLNSSVGAGEEAGFLALIGANPIGIAFGSPSSSILIPESSEGSESPVVPEPAGLAVWSALGLCGLVAVRFRLRHRRPI